jgi:hypothetical protein
MTKGACSLMHAVWTSFLLETCNSWELSELEQGEQKKPVYAEDCPKLKDWLNSFVELHGMYHFKDDPPKYAA